MTKKVMIAYTSMTGNTEMMAAAIAEGIKGEGIEVEVKDLFNVFPDDLVQYDGLLFGSYTYGEGELPDEVIDFYEELNTVDLSHVKSAVFGSCSSDYPHYGRAVDLLIEKLKECGSELIAEPLKIDETPNQEEQIMCKKFGQHFAQHLC